MRRPAVVKPFFGRGNRTSDCRPTGGTLTFSLSFLGRFFLRLSITADGRPTGGAPCCHPEFSNRRLALLPSALFVERSLRCQLGVLNWKRVLPSRTRTDALLQRVVLRRRRSHPNSAVWFSSFRPPLLSAASVDFDFAMAHTLHRLPTADEAGCPVCAQRPRLLSSFRACRPVPPGVAPSASNRYRGRD